ncbi:MAG: hypothetical protein BWY76_01369 [bacterium ADurb.Bin429]|nr:MAG: hypothetical protein BWY76_01369 [bacterium ADurb.Bin429]
MVDPDFPEREPMTPAKRRQAIISIVVMVLSLAGILVFSRVEMLNRVWQAHIVGGTLEFGYGAENTLSDLRLELRTRGGAVYVYTQPVIAGYEKYTIPLADFRSAADQTTEYNPSSGAATSLHISATRDHDQKRLTFTKRL